MKKNFGATIVRPSSRDLSILFFFVLKGRLIQISLGASLILKGFVPGERWGTTTKKGERFYCPGGKIYVFKIFQIFFLVLGQIGLIGGFFLGDFCC